MSESLLGPGSGRHTQEVGLYARSKARMKIEERTMDPIAADFRHEVAPRGYNSSQWLPNLEFIMGVFLR